MNVEAQIEVCKTQIASLRKRIRWLKKRQKLLAKLPECSIYGDQIDFDRLPHKEVIAVVRTLGGKWQKSLNTAAADKPSVDYRTEIDGVTVRCWAGEPPPTCRFVEVEEIIPEQIIPAQVIPAKVKKVRKLVCTGQADPLVIATARVNDPRPLTPEPQSAAVTEAPGQQQPTAPF